MARKQQPSGVPAMVHVDKVLYHIVKEHLCWQSLYEYEAFVQRAVDNAIDEQVEQWRKEQG